VRSSSELVLEVDRNSIHFLSYIVGILNLNQNIK
jgi:hypothetical protein